MFYYEDFYLNYKNTLEFKGGIHHPEPDIRTLEDAKYVLLDHANIDEAEANRPLYYMYRGVCKQEHLNLFKKNYLRYDLTVILPGTIGREFIKTIGHFHPLKVDNSDTYPEYYEVLYGEALYILQKNSRSGDVEEIQAVEAKANDKVFIPPGYGHVTVNPGDTPLVMANLVETNFASIYEPFKGKMGAAYYYIQGENGKGDFLRNEHYHNNVGLEIIAAPNLEQPTRAIEGKSLYEAFVDNPETFNFLK